MAPERKVWKILFVDDEEGIRKVMEVTLADAGYQVLTAPDGETALSLCEKESPQITITDIRMPGYSKGEVVRTMPFSQLFAPGEAERFREALASEEYGGRARLNLFEANLLSKKKDKIPVQLSATVLFEGGEEVGMVSFIRDLPEMRRLEQQCADQARLLHQDKMMSLGRLAASVVHEER